MSDNEQENHSKETQVISPSADSSKKRKLDQDEEDEQSPEEDTVIKTTNALVTDPGAFAIDDQDRPTKLAKTTTCVDGDHCGSDDNKEEDNEESSKPVTKPVVAPKTVAAPTEPATPAGSTLTAKPDATTLSAAKPAQTPAAKPAPAQAPAPAQTPVQAVSHTITANPTHQAASLTNPNPQFMTTADGPVLVEANILEEKDHVAAMYVGRVIGKGGEMIRDLQARAGCRIDVDQNVPDGAPRVITYRGTRQKIDFAKHLVQLLCQDGPRRDVDLPLGEATQTHVGVPAQVIGKIIGRGGEMIRELQNKSQAKIQVDHNAMADDPNARRVTVTGTPLSVTKAQEMITFLTSNPTMDAMTALNMLVEEKTRGATQWGSGPPYATMPASGINMSGSSYGTSTGSAAYAAAPAAGAYSQPSAYSAGSYGGGGSGGQSYYSGHTAPQLYGGPAATATAYYGGAAPAGAIEVEVVPCPKTYMGRIIGSKGATVNDVQKRSGCDIQINQDVPPGQDCEVTLKGTRQGIESAKQMLNEIIEMGPNHPYAGGQGGGGGGGGRYGSSGSGSGSGGYAQHQQQTSYGGYQSAASGGGYQTGSYAQGAQQGGAMSQYQQYQQQAAYGQQQPYGGAATPVPYMAAYAAGAPAASAYGGGVPAAAYVPPTASAWKAATSPDGQVYYYNEKTGESQWEKPPGMA